MARRSIRTPAILCACALLLAGGCDRAPAPPPTAPAGTGAAPAPTGGAPHAADLRQLVEDWSAVRDYLGADALAIRSLDDKLESLSKLMSDHTRVATGLRRKAKLYFEEQPAVPLWSRLDPGANATAAQLFDPRRSPETASGMKESEVDPAVSRLLWNPEPARAKWENVTTALSLGTGHGPAVGAMRLAADRLAPEQASLRAVTDDAYLIVARGGGTSDIDWTTRFAGVAKQLKDFRDGVTAARNEVDAAAMALGSLADDLAFIGQAFDDREFGLRAQALRPAHVNLDARNLGLTDAAFVARIREDLALRQRHAYAMAQKPYHLALPRKTTETWPMAAAVRVAASFDAWYEWATSGVRHPSGNRLDPAAFPVDSPKTRALFEEYRQVVFWRRPILYSEAIVERHLENKPMPMVNEAFVNQAMAGIEKRFAPNLSPDSLRPPTPGVIKAGAYSSWDWYARLNNEVFDRYGDSDLMRDYAVHLQQYFSTPQEAVWLGTPDAPFLR